MTTAMMYRHPTYGDGWSFKGYKCPSENKFNQKVAKGIVGYKQLNTKKDKSYMGEIVFAAK